MWHLHNFTAFTITICGLEHKGVCNSYPLEHKKRNAYVTDLLLGGMHTYEKSLGKDYLDMCHVSVLLSDLYDEKNHTVSHDLHQDTVLIDSFIGNHSPLHYVYSKGEVLLCHFRSNPSNSLFLFLSIFKSTTRGESWMEQYRLHATMVYKVLNSL